MFCPGPHCAVLRAYQGGRHGRHRGTARAAGLPARRGRRVARTPQPGPGRNGPAGWARCSGRLCRTGQGMWVPDTMYCYKLAGACTAAGHSSVPLPAQIAATMHMRLPQQPPTTAHARSITERGVMQTVPWYQGLTVGAKSRLRQDTGWLTKQDDAAACGQQRLHAALQRLPHDSQVHLA